MLCPGLPRSADDQKKIKPASLLQAPPAKRKLLLALIEKQAHLQELLRAKKQKSSDMAAVQGTFDAIFGECMQLS